MVWECTGYVLDDGSVRDLDLMKCTIPYTQEEFDQLKTYIMENGAIREDFTWDDKLLVLSTLYRKR